MTDQTIAHASADRATTDIFHEPLAAQGLHLAYWIRGGPRREGGEIFPNIGVEILLPVGRAEAFKAEADRLGETYALGRPPCEVVFDEGGATWCLVEAMVPQALACDLIVLAQGMGCERRPYPG